MVQPALTIFAKRYITEKLSLKSDSYVRFCIRLVCLKTVRMGYCKIYKPIRLVPPTEELHVTLPLVDQIVHVILINCSLPLFHQTVRRVSVMIIMIINIEQSRFIFRIDYFSEYAEHFLYYYESFNKSLTNNRSLIKPSKSSLVSVIELYSKIAKFY